MSVGWRGMNYGSIDLSDEGYGGSGTYDDLVYSSTQAFVCGFKISSPDDFDLEWVYEPAEGIIAEGIDGVEIIFCHQDAWSVQKRVTL